MEESRSLCIYARKATEEKGFPPRAQVSAAIVADRGSESIFLIQGSVPEWLNGPHSKCGMPERASGVQILPLPQRNKINNKSLPCARGAKFDKNQICSAPNPVPSAYAKNYPLWMIFCISINKNPPLIPSNNQDFYSTYGPHNYMLI